MVQMRPYDQEVSMHCHFNNTNYYPIKRESIMIKRIGFVRW